MEISDRGEPGLELHCLAVDLHPCQTPRVLSGAFLNSAAFQSSCTSHLRYWYVWAVYILFSQRVSKDHLSHILNIRESDVHKHFYMYFDAPMKKAPLPVKI